MKTVHLKELLAAADALRDAILNYEYMQVTPANVSHVQNSLRSLRAELDAQLSDAFVSMTDPTMKTGTVMLKSEKTAMEVHSGVLIMQKRGSTLIALNKELSCDGKSKEQLKEDEIKRLEDLGWEWDEELEVWKYYTGH